MLLLHHDRINRPNGRAVSLLTPEVRPLVSLTVEHVGKATHWVGVRVRLLMLGRTTTTTSLVLY